MEITKMEELKKINYEMENLLELLHSGNVSDSNTKINILNKLDKLHKQYIEKFIEEEIEKEEDIFDKNGMFIR